jgi:glutamate 5-kinase
MANDNIMVVKVGASSIIDGQNINEAFLDNLAYDLYFLKENEGIHPILVVSGSIKLGVLELGYEKQPEDDDIVGLQRCACVGQPRLFQIYDKFLRQWKMQSSQLLVTYHNLEDPKEEKNIEKRIKDDIEHNIITQVNYNDGIDGRGIILYDREGNVMVRDNDMLAATIAKYVHAQRFVILTNSNSNGTMGGAKIKQAAIDLATSNGTHVIVGESKEGLYNIIADSQN